jgi:N-acetylglucosaminyldiphosphoundecaprenol N-acetyl-beta-D-mannosaminyltransferase
MREILGVVLSGTSYLNTASRCIEWAKRGESRAIFFANVHVVMEAFDDRAFRAELNRADIVNPDGMPLVWTLRAMGEKHATRVYGPDATQVILAAAEQSCVPVGFYGGSEATLTALVVHVMSTYPNLQIVFKMSPPFRLLDSAEDEVIVQRICESGAKLLFVGLGCPKQEHWVMDHRGRVPAVMLAVGAAFDFLARTKPQAPRWAMRAGLEWVFRLASEPRRLAIRYLKHNPRFVLLFIHQWLTQRRA